VPPTGGFCLGCRNERHQERPDDQGLRRATGCRRGHPDVGGHTGEELPGVLVKIGRQEVRKVLYVQAIKLICEHIL